MRGRARRAAWLAWLGALALGGGTVGVAGCGGGRERADAGTDAPEVLAPDAGADAGGGSYPLDEPIELDPCPDEPCTGGHDAQIHLATASDGDGAWVVYSAVVAPRSTFDVFVARVSRAGAVELAPTQLSTTAGNHIDPELALGSAGQALVSWTLDDGSGGDSNLQILRRLVRRDGTVVGAGDERLTTRWAGADVTTNHVGFVVAHGGTPAAFALAGVRALPDASTFQVFVQTLDEEGAQSGEALAPLLEPMVSQGPAAAAFTAEGLRVAYERGDATTEVVLAGAGLDAPISVAGAGAAAPTFVADASRAFVAYADGDDVHVLDVVDPSAPRELGAVGARGPDHSPRLVLDGAGGAALIWMHVLSGIRNQVWAARLDATGVGEPRLLFDAPGAPAYVPSIAHVEGDVFFVVWSEGDTSPHFRGRGRFVELPR